MTHRVTSRFFVCLLVLVVALPLALGSGAGSSSSHPQPPRPTGPDVELLVGQLSCGPFPGKGTLISFRPLGTLGVSTGGGGDLISRVIPPPEDPCPGIINVSTKEILEALGCEAALDGTNTLKFVCQDRRNAILNVMATVSEGVLAGSF